MQNGTHAQRWMSISNSKSIWYFYGTTGTWCNRIIQNSATDGTCNPINHATCGGCTLQQIIDVRLHKNISTKFLPQWKINCSMGSWSWWRCSWYWWGTVMDICWRPCRSWRRWIGTRIEVIVICEAVDINEGPSSSIYCHITINVQCVIWSIWFNVVIPIWAAWTFLFDSSTASCQIYEDDIKSFLCNREM